MKRNHSAYLLFSMMAAYAMWMILQSCANIIPPSGGPRDSLPPLLLSAVPKDSSTNFTGNKITLTFDEYVDIQNAFENIIVSPLPKNVPVVNSNFKVVTIKIKDTLEPNTTYSINFGNALRDINEGNVAKDFTYLFSTGTTIDQNSISGSVVLAETGKIDTTLIVVLHRNADDSAVSKEKPRFMARLNGKGRFQFNNLPAGRFAIYALPNDFSRQYDDSTKPFAFADSIISTTSSDSVRLLAYTLTRIDTVKKPAAAPSPEKAKEDKRLQVQANALAGRQDLLSDLQLIFSKPLRSFDTSKIVLYDTNYRAIAGYKIAQDTASNLIKISVKWPPDVRYKLVIDSLAVIDTLGGHLSKMDTITFATKKLEDYGSIKVRFTNIDLTKNPVLQLVQNDRIVIAVPLTQNVWERKLINPGDYDLRILYDKNKNGVWDPGHFFGNHRQPELVVPINTKLSIRANWDNEKDITL